MRLAVSTVFLLAGGNPLDASAVTVAALVGLSAGLTFTDIARRHEWVLIGNLALTPARLLGLVALPAVVGELGLQLAHLLV